MTTQQLTHPLLVAIRAAHHAEEVPNYDRVVFEFDGPLPPLRIEYVKQLFGGGSGLPVPIAGRAILQVEFRPAQAHDDNGQETAPHHLKPKLPIVREIISTDDFEAVVTYGIGLRRKAELRILTLDSPNRLVIDFLL
ncbi:MAG: hypothetical protein ACJ8CR_23380 [Roseiflexaceae bacterium]